MLDVQKAYDIVWWDGLWLKLWDMGAKGRMWHVNKTMYEASRGVVILEGGKSDVFRARRDTWLQLILFSVFIIDLLKEVMVFSVEDGWK